MHPNHHIAYDGGKINPLRVEDDIYKVSNVVSETTRVGGRENVVAKNLVEDLDYRPTILVGKLLEPDGKMATQSLHSCSLFL